MSQCAQWVPGRMAGAPLPGEARCAAERFRCGRRGASYDSSLQCSRSASVRRRVQLCLPESHVGTADSTR